MTDHQKFVISELIGSAQVMEQLARESTREILQAAELLISCLMSGGKILLFGNGGSAADAQHFASELVGRYRRDRQPLPAIALTTDTALMTSISNDYGFDEVFARQVTGLASPGDTVIGISTSGRSANVIAGMQAARDAGAHTIAMTGSNQIGAENIGGGALAEIVLAAPSTDTPRIQEAHGVIIHILCDLIEQSLGQTPDIEGEEAE